MEIFNPPDDCLRQANSSSRDINFLFMFYFVPFVFFVDRVLQNNPFNGCFWMAAEVGQQTKAHSCRFQVVHYLRFMFSCRGSKSFKLNDNDFVANKIGDIDLSQWLAFIEKLQFPMCDIWNPSF